MTTEEKAKYAETNKTVEQARAVWNHESTFTKKGKEMPVTFLICQKNTKAATQLALESLLRFYPDINILVVDDESNDDSLLYLRYKSLVVPNLTLFEKGAPYLGHGGAMNLAIREKVTTEYVMLMDSDVIIERGGFVEDMLKEFETNSKLYAIGTLQISSYKNNGGEPESIEDITPYGNPQMSLYHVPTYKELDADFLNDGTPCILNMKAARDVGLEVKYYPTDLYCTHCGGSSWTEPRTTWINDHDVKLRPFLTIISDGILPIQTDSDFDVVPIGFDHKGEYIFTDGSPKFEVNSGTFLMRFNIHGEYVLDLSNQNSQNGIPQTFVTELKKKVIEEKIPDEIEVEGFKCLKRQHWQQTVR